MLDIFVFKGEKMNRFILPLVLIIGLSGCSNKATSDIHHLEFDSIELSKGKDKKNCKVTLCHTPPAKDHEIKVDCHAVFAHLKHGDYFGECKDKYDDDDCDHDDKCDKDCDHNKDCDDTDGDTDTDVDTDTDTDYPDTDTDDTGFGGDTGLDTDSDIDTDTDEESKVWLQNGCNSAPLGIGFFGLVLSLLMIRRRSF